MVQHDCHHAPVGCRERDNAHFRVNRPFHMENVRAAQRRLALECPIAHDIPAIHREAAIDRPPSRDTDRCEPLQCQADGLQNAGNRWFIVTRIAAAHPREFVRNELAGVVTKIIADVRRRVVLRGMQQHRLTRNTGQLVDALPNLIGPRNVDGQNIDRQNAELPARLFEHQRMGVDRFRDAAAGPAPTDGAGNLDVGGWRNVDFASTSANLCFRWRHKKASC